MAKILQVFARNVPQHEADKLFHEINFDKDKNPSLRILDHPYYDCPHNMVYLPFL